MNDTSKWVSLPNSKREPVPGAQVLGSVDPGEMIDVTVIVRPRKGSRPLARAVAALAAVPPHARRHLSRQEYAAAHGADPGDFHAVAAFAAAHGLTAHDANVARRTVHLVGRADAMTEAFKVDLKTYRLADATTHRGNAADVQIPEELSGIVQAVIGFDTRPHARPHFRVAPRPETGAAPHAAPHAFNPPDLAALYNFPPGADGTGQVIGILELTAPHGSGFRLPELRQYFQNLGLGNGPSITAVSIDGAQNNPGTNPNDPKCADGEVALDIEVVGAIAPGAKIVVYFAPNTGKGFFDLINHAVHDTVNKPTVLSLSWGGPENANDPTTCQIHKVLQAAAALGVTITVASGDNGSSDDPNQSSPAQVDFPASSPFALACGGTKLTNSGNIQEVVWNEPTGGATGGGVSRIFKLPTYQSGAGVPPAADPPGPVGRGVPDICGDADPQTGYNIHVDGQAMVIGGTSAVAPLWAGLVARLNQKIGHSVGLINPTIYANPGALFDITQGNNGDYQAGPGWDPCTGLGSPNGTKLLAVLSGPAPAGHAAARSRALQARRRAIVRRRVAAVISQRVSAIMKNQGRQIVRRRVAVLMREHRAAGHGPAKLAQIRQRER
jgi:kumamolisin